MECGDGLWEGTVERHQVATPHAGCSEGVRSQGPGLASGYSPSFPRKSALFLECLEGDNGQTGGRKITGPTIVTKYPPCPRPWEYKDK